jgi:hypothetical protein
MISEYNSGGSKTLTVAILCAFATMVLTGFGLLALYLIGHEIVTFIKDLL